MTHAASASQKSTFNTKTQAWVADLTFKLSLKHARDSYFKKNLFLKKIIFKSTPVSCTVCSQCHIEFRRVAPQIFGIFVLGHRSICLILLKGFGFKNTGLHDARVFLVDIQVPYWLSTDIREFFFSVLNDMGYLIVDVYSPYFYI